MSALVLVLTVTAGACGDEARTEQVSWTRVPDPPGHTRGELEWSLEAVFGGSSCSQLAGWHVSETETEVVVVATASFDDDEDCTGDQVREPHVVVLEAPLGARRLVGCEPDDDSADCMRLDRIP